MPVKSRRKLQPLNSNSSCRRPEALSSELGSRIMSFPPARLGLRTWVEQNKHQKMTCVSRRAVSSVSKLFTDGASRGNPGRAGIGAALFSNDCTLQARLSSYLGHCTNNAAEYRACLEGLLMARALQVPRVIVLSDSQLMVRHLQGRYVVRNSHLKVLHNRVSDVAADFALCRFVYIKREDNAVADALANAALDTGQKDHLVLEQPFNSPPVGSLLENAQVQLSRKSKEQTGLT